MATPVLKLFFHDRCFDGAASAAIFGDFYKQRHGGEADIVLHGLSHSLEDPFRCVSFDGDDHACVDFRYCSDPRLTWWIDHHQSAFQPAELQQVFEERQRDTHFFDPAAPSCAGLARRVLREAYDYEPDDPRGHWAELVHWAEVIDSASFANAREAVALESPATKLMAWFARNLDSSLSARVIECLGRYSLEEISEMPFLKERLVEVVAEQWRGVELVREHLEFVAPVAVYDLGEVARAPSGFAAYLLEPDTIFSIGLFATERATRIAVGSNPWGPFDERRHNIAAICERYGGGGHPRVGGITLPPGQLDRAREIVAEIREILSASD